MARDLEQLAELIRIKNQADQKIAEEIGRPALPGNIGEYVAARIFRIDLERPGNNPGYDGKFREPSGLAGKSVNIKAYSRHESLLDISPHPSDYYLILTGPPGPASARPWIIESVFLFDSRELLGNLKERGVKVGVATSVRKEYWEAARIFPGHPGSPLELDESQVADLKLFAAAGEDQ